MKFIYAFSLTNYFTNIWKPNYPCGLLFVNMIYNIKKYMRYLNHLIYTYKLSLFFERIISRRKAQDELYNEFMNRGKWWKKIVLRVIIINLQMREDYILQSLYDSSVHERIESVGPRSLATERIKQRCSLSLGSAASPRYKRNRRGGVIPHYIFATVP